MRVDLAAVMPGTEVARQMRPVRRNHVEETLPMTDNSELIIGVIFPSLVLVTAVTILRLLVRKTMPPKRLFWDDAWVVVAAVLTFSLCIISIQGAKHGLGQHEWDLTNHDGEVETTVMLMWAGQLLYSFAISAVKISIISSYFRIFPYKRLHQGLWVVLAVTIAFLVASVVATIFICRPVEAAWNPSVRTPMSCYRFIDVLYANAIVNVTTDILLCTAPLPYFLRLHLPVKQKISASVLFMIGGLAAVASLIRLSGLYQVSPDGADITYSIAEPLVWSVLECAISIVCISVPPMRPLFAKAAPGPFEDPDRVKQQIARRIGGITAAARHPCKSMMKHCSPTGTGSSSSDGANSALSSQRQLQLMISSFENIEMPLGSTETVVMSLREMEDEEVHHPCGDGVRRRDDEEASIEGKNSSGDTRGTIT